MSGRIWLALLAVAIVTCEVVIRRGFTLWDYPWYFPDSFDWLSNGMRYAFPTQEFYITHRAMLLPIVVAGAWVAGVSDLVVWWGLLWHFVAALAIGWGLTGCVPSRTRMLAVGLFLVHATTLGQAAYLGSDVAATALLTVTFFGVIRFAYFAEWRALIVAAVAAALGVHCQYMVVVLLPVLAGAILLAPQIQQRGGYWHWLRYLASWRSFAVIAVGLGIAVALVAPRLSLFGVLYEERVSHLSLLSWWYPWGRWFYLAAIMAAISWPLLVSAAYGLWQMICVTSERFAALVLLAWAASIWFFFAAAYNWPDVRFMIYLTVPVLCFAARGIDALSSRLSSNAARMLVFLGAGFIAHCSSSSDPFDNQFSLTPWHVVSREGNQGWLIKSKVARPYFFDHVRSAERRRAELHSEIDAPMISVPVHSLLLEESLREVKRPVVFVATMQPHERYIIRNRNMVYLGRAMESVGSWAEAEAALAGPGTTIIITEELLRNAPPRLFEGLMIIAKAGRYVLLREQNKGSIDQ